MTYKYILVNNYITGWVVGGNDITPLPEMELIGALLDEYGNYKYQLIDGKIILNPQPPTPEQLRTKYEQIVKQEITKRYTIDDEIKLLYRGTDLEKKDHEDYIALCKEVATKEVYKEASSDTTYDN